MSMIKKFIMILLLPALLSMAIFFISSRKLSDNIVSIYKNGQSEIMADRNSGKILIKENPSGYFAEYSEDVPDNFKGYLIGKEDKYFYYHRGINPISSFRAAFNYLSGKKNLASSTLTQQLAKILLKNENDRSLKNKITESIYALSMEINLSKDDILEMYANTVYFGNKAQGINEASRLYFGLSPGMLSKEQTLQLISTISGPSINNPFLVENASSSNDLAGYLKIETQNIEPLTTEEIAAKRKQFNDYVNGTNRFEMESLGVDCADSCNLTIDGSLSDKVREILKRNLLSSSDKKVTNGAVVVIKLPENELLSVIGSPDPRFGDYGYQINMAKEPRPIGSTIKPFIYLKAFEKGLRPYTLVEDKEYKYMIGSGFPLYPKNYDYQYHGIVNLHYALSNSLNVPSVIVLEDVGLDNFYKFMLDDLQLKPVQDMENYQLGIALGELETDLLSLSYYFTIFPSGGQLHPLKIYKDKNDFKYNLKTDFSLNKTISKESYVQLINKVLSDRKTGVEQFGIKSSLNLPYDNYAVKTGTSREFHDSWTIGYTPDFLVGVWVGNSDNTPMDNVSGQSGAGSVWNEVMSLMMNSAYNKKTSFNFRYIKDYYENDFIEYGLAGDDYEKQKMMLMKYKLIASPHDNDTFLFENNTQIPLKSKEESKWYINDELLGSGKEIIFVPQNYGIYKIEAASTESEKKESISIRLEKDR
ncbi:MAG: transglycosylase domain-containing protein [Candidatus Paceibacterota bacterium]|jgi:membrane carboxypeptidase/penicillin-binding protein PbpC